MLEKVGSCASYSQDDCNEQHKNIGLLCHYLLTSLFDWVDLMLIFKAHCQSQETEAALNLQHANIDEGQGHLSTWRHKRYHSLMEKQLGREESSQSWGQSM